MSTDKLPDSWTRVKFGDVVRNANENSRDLEADGIERVVGLDHLDPGSLRLVRWDNLADLPDGTTFTRKFKRGQVLFGKRRAYQRKVALPDFEGVCSGDILVFEPADKRMLVEFLPYVAQSDGFFEHALGTSAGSLSPRTKWAELAKYEFALPPLEDQQRIAEVLASADSATGAVARTLRACEDLERSVISERAWNKARPLRPIRDVWSGAQYFDGDWIESKDQASAGVRLLQLADIGAGRFLDKSSRFVSNETFERLHCREVLAGDFLVSRMADPIGRTCVVPNLDHRLITVVDACVIRPPTMSTHEHSYWLALLNSAEWTRACERAAGGTTRTRISRSKLELLRIPDLTLRERIDVGATLAGIAQVRDALRREEDGCRALARSLRETTLGGGVHVQ